MTGIVTYKIRMSQTGRLSHLPDSQRIFGALIYLYDELYSSEEASALVSKIRDGEVYLALSNLLPRGYLPVPQPYLYDRLNRKSEGQNQNDQRTLKQIYKAIKDRTYAPWEQIKQMLAKDSKVDLVYPYAKLRSAYHIHAAIDSLRYDMPGLDSNVYSVPELAVEEILARKTEPRIIQEFDLFLAADDHPECLKLIQALQQAKEQGRRFFLGPRASQGLNTFIIKEIDQEPQERTDQSKNNAYLNLGMLLPQKIDFKSSSLKLYTSERRPYHVPEGWDQKEFSRKFISFIDIGSIVYVKEGLQKAGQSIPSPYNQSRDIVFGNAYLMPLDMQLEVSEDDRSNS